MHAADDTIAVSSSLQSLKRKVQESGVTQAHTELIKKSSEDIRELEKELEARETQLRRTEDDLAR